MAHSGQGIAGRPRDQRVTAALLEATLFELAERGFEKCTIASISQRARTSKQAIYRRYDDKTELVAAAIEHAQRAVGRTAPQRVSVAEDLRHALSALVSSLQDTSLGAAMRALGPHRDLTPIAAVLEDEENARRLGLRQIFIATPFETDMETRIDLLFGLIFLRVFVSNVPVTEADIEKAIYLVLGLVAPRDPSPVAVPHQ